jgi:hypothetical protein
MSTSPQRLRLCQTSVSKASDSGLEYSDRRRTEDGAMRGGRWVWCASRDLANAEQELGLQLWRTWPTGAAKTSPKGLTFQRYTTWDPWPIRCHTVPA